MKQRITAFTMSQVTGPGWMLQKDITTRVIIPINIKGNTLQLRFSNRDGRKAACMEEVWIAKCNKTGKIESGMGIPVTASGNTELRFEAGTDLTSDEILLEVEPGDYLAVSIYCSARPRSVCPIGSHALQLIGQGNQCNKNFEPNTKPHWIVRQAGTVPTVCVPYFRALDIISGSKPAVISCLGDSITVHCKWYTPLLERLYQQYPGGLCLLNAGISGNRLLSDSPVSVGKTYGAAGIRRIEWDTFTDYGVTHILFALGINDLNLAELPLIDKAPIPMPEVYKRGCEELIAKAHKRGIKVLAYSLYPALTQGAPKDLKREAFRQSYNEVIHSGIFDGVIDIEEALKDPARPAGYKEGYCVPDGLHLNETGGAVLAETAYFALKNHVENDRIKLCD